MNRRHVISMCGILEIALFLFLSAVLGSFGIYGISIAIVLASYICCITLTLFNIHCLSTFLYSNIMSLPPVIIAVLESLKVTILSITYIRILINVLYILPLSLAFMYYLIKGKK